MDRTRDGDASMTGMQIMANLLEEFKRCREGFLDGFSTAELVALYRAYVASESCRLQDTWSREQVALALDGHPPDWHDDGAPDLTTLKLCRLTAEEAERVQSLYDRYPQEARDVDASLFRRGWVRAAVDAGRGVQLSRAALGQRELPEARTIPRCARSASQRRGVERAVAHLRARPGRRDHERAARLPVRPRVGPVRGGGAGGAVAALLPRAQGA